MQKKENGKKISAMLSEDAAFALGFLADNEGTSMTEIIELLVRSSFLAVTGKTAQEAVNRRNEVMEYMTSEAQS